MTKEEFQTVEYYLMRAFHSGFASRKLHSSDIVKNILEGKDAWNDWWEHNRTQAELQMVHGERIYY